VAAALFALASFGMAVRLFTDPPRPLADQV